MPLSPLCSLEARAMQVSFAFLCVSAFTLLSSALATDSWPGSEVEIEDSWNDLRKNYEERKDLRAQDRERIDRAIEKKLSKIEDTEALRDETDWAGLREAAQMDMAEGIGGAMSSYGEYLVDFRNPLRILGMNDVARDMGGALSGFRDLVNATYDPPFLELEVQDLYDELDSLEAKGERIDKDIATLNSEVDAIDDFLDLYREEVVDTEIADKVETSKEVVFEFARNVGTKRDDLLEKYGAFCSVFGHDPDNCGKQDRCFRVTDKRFGVYTFCLGPGEETNKTVTPSYKSCQKCGSVPAANEVCDRTYHNQDC